jgi:hypothetical protein
MHDGQSPADKMRADRRKQDWLKGLEEQVREQKARKEAEERQWREDRALDPPPARHVAQAPLGQGQDAQRFDADHQHQQPQQHGTHEANYQHEYEQTPPGHRFHDEAAPRRRGAGAPHARVGHAFPPGSSYGRDS